MASVTLHQIQKRFGIVQAVKDVSLDIEDGELVVLVGPSGCGKSTTLRMIAGLEEVTGGEISFDGVVVNDLSPRERNVAMVFQSYALYPHMSIHRNLAFTLEQSKMPKQTISEVVTRTARMLGIEELLARKPKELSGGQRQRVAMGRAIVREPDVFLFDEPLSNLDAALRAQMRIEIKKLHRMLKTTIIYVTHDQIEAMTLADRIVVMDRGEVVQVGEPMSIYERPNTKFVAGFIGSPKINFIPGCVEETSDGGLCVRVASNVCLAVPAEKLSTYARYKNAKVEIGIRPEHIHEGSTGAVGTSFQVMVDVVEPTGADTIVVFSLDGTLVTARGRPYGMSKAGGSGAFTIDMKNAHLIDPISEKVIYHG
jgi:multiple sugar transport system ATP-binding protein